MQTSSDRFVVLRGGLALPLEPVTLVLDLEARGFHLGRGDDDRIVVRPFSRLTDSDRAALRRWRHHVLALIAYVPEVS